MRPLLRPQLPNPPGTTSGLLGWAAVLTRQLTHHLFDITARLPGVRVRTNTDTAPNFLGEIAIVGGDAFIGTDTTGAGVWKQIT